MSRPIDLAEEAADLDYRGATVSMLGFAAVIFGVEVISGMVIALTLGMKLRMDRWLGWFPMLTLEGTAGNFARVVSGSTVVTIWVAVIAALVCTIAVRRDQSAQWPFGGFLATAMAASLVIIEWFRFSNVNIISDRMALNGLTVLGLVAAVFVFIGLRAQETDKSLAALAMRPTIQQASH